MLDQLVTVINKDRWEEIIIPEIGSAGRLFAHMVRVRDVYRDSFSTGRIRLPGNSISRDADLEVELIRSRKELADAMTNSKVDRIYWSDDYSVSPDEICSIAIQHEAIHQGQWYVALKQAGIVIPEQWRSDWHLW